MDDEKCISCGICVSVCPHNALSLENGLPITTGKCKVCGLCASSCITKAISMRAKKFTDETIISEFKNLSDPKIVVFSCRRVIDKNKNYGDARVISLMCSARIDPFLIAEAFVSGAWGVMMTHCESCKNDTGSKEAIIKAEFVKKLLEKSGIEKERIQIVEGDFEDALQSFSAELRSLGELKADAAERIKRATLDQRLRVLVAKMREVTEEGNVYGEKIEREAFERLLDDAIISVVNSLKILDVLGEGAEIHEISEKTGLDEKEVLDTILEMRRRDLISVEAKEKTLFCPKG